MFDHRIVRIRHGVLPGGRGHELHQPHRALRRSRAGFVMGFDLDERPDERRVDSVGPRTPSR